eukprot:869580-Pleurochrysis_carterae.AAC.2
MLWHKNRLAVNLLSRWPLDGSLFERPPMIVVIRTPSFQNVVIRTSSFELCHLNIAVQTSSIEALSFNNAII